MSTTSKKLSEELKNSSEDTSVTFEKFSKLHADLIKKFEQIDKDKLEELALSQFELNSENIKLFLGLLSKNTTLKMLTVGAPYASDIPTFTLDDREPLYKILIANISLTELNFTNLFLGDSIAASIITALETNNSLTKLNLAVNKLRLQSAIRLGAMLKINKTLKTLDLHANEFNDGESGKSLAEGLAANTVLTALNVRYVGFTKESGIAIGRALLANVSLGNIDLSSNYLIDSEAGLLIAQAIATHKYFSLNLESIRLGREAGEEIGRAILKNTSLVTLQLTHCQLGPKAGISIAKSLETHPSMTYLDLCNNNFGSETVASFCQAIKANKMLTYLNLANNKFSDPDGLKILEALQCNRTLNNFSDGINYDKEYYFISAIIEGLMWRNKLESKIRTKASYHAEKIDTLEKLTKFFYAFVKKELEKYKYYDWWKYRESLSYSEIKPAEKIEYFVKSAFLYALCCGDLPQITAIKIELAERLMLERMALDEFDYFKSFESEYRLMCEDFNLPILPIFEIISENSKKKVTLIQSAVDATFANLEEVQPTIIDFERARIDLKSLKKLEIFLNSNKTLKTLKLRHCKLDRETGIMIAKALETHHLITHLDLCGNNFGSETVIDFCNLIKANKTLTKLNLASNKFSDSDGLQLLDALQSNKILREVEIFHNFDTQKSFIFGAIKLLMFRNETEPKIQDKTNSLQLKMDAVASLAANFYRFVDIMDEWGTFEWWRYRKISCHAEIKKLEFYFKSAYVYAVSCSLPQIKPIREALSKRLTLGEMALDEFEMFKTFESEYKLMCEDLDLPILPIFEEILISCKKTDIQKKSGVPDPLTFGLALHTKETHEAVPKKEAEIVSISSQIAVKNESGEKAMQKPQIISKKFI